MDIITSKDNQKIKFIKKIRDDSKERYLNSLFFVEGERIINDIDKSLIHEVYISDLYSGKVPYIDKDKIFTIKDNIFSDIKDTKTTQGIIALVKFKSNTLKLTDKILILDNIQDPGNMGTILRTAEASGFRSIMLVNNCVDVYSPKTIRASMGSITRLYIYKSNDYLIDINKLKDEKYKIIGTFLNTSKKYTDSLYKGKIAIVIGNEANGISNDIENICDEKVYIPMDGEIESLNASIATAIILYEVKRQYEYTI